MSPDQNAQAQMPTSKTPIRTSEASIPMIRQLWQTLRRPHALRVIHCLPKGLKQLEPPLQEAQRERQREWLRDRNITQVKAVIAVKP